MLVDMAGQTQQEVVSVFTKSALVVFVSLAIFSQTYLELPNVTMSCDIIDKNTLMECSMYDVTAKVSFNHNNGAAA